MPFLDVTDVLDDPDFQDVFDVVRSAQTVGSDGLAVNTSQTFANIIGVVQPATGQMDRAPEGVLQHGSIVIYTKFRLQTGSASQSADEVTYNGSVYVISDQQDWSRFGVGYIRATGTLKPVNPAP